MHDEPTRELLHSQQGRYFGKYRGLVRDNFDVLQRRGRLKVVVPQVLGDAEVWALPCVPYAGAGVGFFALPPTGTAVWVEFEAGDPTYPIWTGCVWPLNEIDASELLGPTNKFLKTDMFTLHFDETKGELSIKSKGQAEIVMTAAEIKIKAPMVTVENGVGAKVELTGIKIGMNNGAFEVM
jgi:hypothetical protein